MFIAEPANIGSPVLTSSTAKIFSPCITPTSDNSTPPLPRVRPDARDTIELLDMGRLFSGPYLCDRVNHEYTGNSFETSYTLMGPA
jgi:hypothetical protein